MLLKGRKNALLCLPEDEPLRRKAEMAVQLYKDFNFRVADGFEAEARKTLNMVQQWQAATGYTLGELGIAPWVTKAQQQAQKVVPHGIPAAGKAIALSQIVSTCAVVFFNSTGYFLFLQALCVFNMYIPKKVRRLRTESHSAVTMS